MRLIPPCGCTRRGSTGGLPFLITEYKDGLQGGPGTSYGGKHGDMAYAAAFIIHTTPQLTDLDAFSWCVGVPVHKTTPW